MSETVPPGGDDGDASDVPTVEPTDPFANLPKPRPGLEIRSPYPSAPSPLPPHDEPPPDVREP